MDSIVYCEVVDNGKPDIDKYLVEEEGKEYHFGYDRIPGYTCAKVAFKRSDGTIVDTSRTVVFKSG